MRLAVAGGGTGGHIYPAVSAIEALSDGGTAPEVLWLGAAGRPEQEMARSHGWEFHPVQTAQVRGSGLRTPINAAVAVGGAFGASKALRGFRAQVLLATGGYVSVPGTLGARLAGVPVVLFLPDASPGWAVSFLRHFAQVSAASSEAAAANLGRGAVVTGYPVRQAFLTASRPEARAALGLGERPAVLVLGGSSGARKLNEAIIHWAPVVLEQADIVHIAGRRDYEMVVQQAASAGLSTHPGYHLYSYIERLPEAMVASDLVITRAGAAVIGELTAAAKPSILVPGSFGGGHQRHNASYMADRGCGVVIGDDQVMEQLGPAVIHLLEEPGRLTSMAENARSLAHPDAARRLAGLLERTAAGGGSAD